MNAFLASALVGPLLVAQGVPSGGTPAGTPIQGAPAPTDQVAQLQQMPWFARLGYRSLGVETKLPVVDCVVLVPDEGAYLAEIARWTPKARWPVLFEDDAFAPRFIRAFRPAKVLRRPAGSPPADGAAVMAACSDAVCRAWGGDPARGQGADAAMRAVGLVPPGIVAASAADPAWPAAVALAAGRGQPLAWIDAAAGTSANDILDAKAFSALDAAVRAAFSQSGYSFDRLGDDLDALTLCRRSALRVALPDPPGGRNPKLPPDKGPYSLTDALCRNADGSRYAFAAQVFGDRVRSTYMAMCSLFLRRTETWMFDGYALRGGPAFASYSFERAAPTFTELGFATRSWEGSNGTIGSWRALLPTGIGPDVLLMNSSGNCDFFEAEPGSSAPSTDIPVLRKPLALSMIHSFSLQVPDSGFSVGGRWLEHGVYAYAGSVHEPFVTAFVPPATLAQRLASLAPFLVASRHWDADPIPQVWRIATIGDPLMTVPSPKVFSMVPAREPAPADAGDDVRDSARASLERVKSAEGDGLRSALAGAMRDLVLVGDDAVAAQLWKVAKAKGAGDCVARMALGPLFRAGTRMDFMDAWALAKEPSPEQRDMLWHLWAADLGSLRDVAAVDVLKANLRAPRIDMDAKALLAAVRLTSGRRGADEWLNEVILRAGDADTKRRLAELQGKG